MDLTRSKMLPATLVQISLMVGFLALCTAGVVYHRGLNIKRDTTSAADTLRALEDNFWEWRMADAPEFSTAVGESKHNDLLESFDITVYKQRETIVLDYLRRLQAVDRNQLDQHDRLDYDIFNHYLRTYDEGSVFDMYQSINPINFLEGMNADPGRLQTIIPFDTVGDFENYLQRLQKLPIQIYQQIALLRHAISIGHTLNNVSVAAVPDQIDNIVDIENVEDSSLYSPAFTDTLDESDVPLPKQQTLRSRAQTAIGDINRALLRLKDVLENEYIPAGRATWGISGWPDGKALYELCLKYHTSTDMTPQQVHDLGLREVQRIRGNMLETLKRLHYTGTIKQFYDGIRIDPRFLANSSEALLESFEDFIYNRITPKLPTLFKDIPDLPLKIEEMSYDGPGGVYLAGTPDGSIPGIFYANVMRPETRPTIADMALVLHETMPGHHLQSIYSLTSNLPPYRGLMEDANYYRMPATFPINTAYLEGWGLYSEYLGEEMGLYTDDYMLMGRYSEEIYRACRLVVDTGLHYFGWERERAIQYFLDNTVETPETVQVEIDRYLTWPGQATAYKVGEIKIRQLRQKATMALGSKFDVRDFHSVLLKNGGMPLNLLERLVDQWIASVNANDNSNANTPDSNANSHSTLDPSQLLHQAPPIG